MDNAIAQATAYYTEKLLVKEGFNYNNAVVARRILTLAFLDGVIKHLNDATPVEYFSMHFKREDGECPY